MKLSTIATTIIIVLFTCCLFVLWMGRSVDVKTDRNVEGLSEGLRDILYLGAFAPSSHNIQSWKVTVFPADKKLEIETDVNRNLPMVDPADREILISLGCYTQTLVNAFKGYGYEPKTRIDGKIVTINYGDKVSDIDEDMIHNIKKRHTDKSVFNDSEVTSVYLSRYADERDHILYYPFESNESSVIRELTLEAYEKEANDDSMASELSDWLRLSDKETIENKDGLPAEQLGIRGIKKFFYYVITNHESAKGKTFAKQGIDQTRSQLGSGSGFILITSKGDAGSLINAGRETVDVWNYMTENNISVQPMSYALEIPEYTKKLTETLGLNEEPQMLLRTGMVKKYGNNAGIRRNLSDYITVR